MNENANHYAYIPITTLAMSFLATVLLFFWQGAKGFSLWDEGFLWYGAQRVMQGDVPIRDFMSYDPGRYYWSAALMSLFGDSGIMSLRAAVAVFQMLGLFVGMMVIAESGKNRGKSEYLFWSISAVTLAVWMFPRHKLFDISLSIFLIGILAYLARKPIPKRYFLTGLCVGMAAVFGRNHGVYGVAGSLGVMLWLSIKRSSEPHFVKAGSIWASGVLAGYTPVLLMLALVPGFASSFYEGLIFLFRRGSTNLALDLPWPWPVYFEVATLADASRGVLIGLFFMGTLAFGALSVFWVVSRRLMGRPEPPALTASAFLAFPYAHYAFSRADVMHLAHGIFPLLVGGLAALSTADSRIKWPLSVTLCSASLWVMVGFHPGWHCRRENHCVVVEISGDNLEVDHGTANDIAVLRQLVDRYAPNDESFIVAPFWPGAYALFERKSPMWAIYALWQRGPQFEAAEIARIKSANPAFVLVFDFALDGREDLRFRNSHPDVFEFMQETMDRVPIDSRPSFRDSAYLVFKARVQE